MSKAWGPSKTAPALLRWPTAVTLLEVELERAEAAYAMARTPQARSVALRLIAQAAQRVELAKQRAMSGEADADAGGAARPA